MVTGMTSRPSLACVLLAAAAACRHDADVRGALTQSGRGVPGATVTMECPDGSKRVTTTSAGGEFRFEELGPGVDDACLLQVQLPGGWVPTQSIASRCAQRDAKTGLCAQATFAFQLP